MNNDIRISCSFPEHYKTKKLIAIAGHAAPFSLISLWVYAARNKPDGFLDNMDNFDIEIAGNWTGQPNQLFDALVKCKFLTVADEGYYLHDWEIHQPYASSAEERSAKARFSILARHNRDLHTKLKEQGVNGLSISDYKEYTKRIRPENDANTKTYKNLTPSPLPYPVPLPAPEPLPIPKENNTPAFSDKKASNDLLFADELGDDSLSSDKSKDCDDLEKQFDEFWAMYPKKVDKPGAKRKYIAAIKKKNVAHETIMAGLKGYVVCDEVLKGFICHPTTWLNQERWAVEHKNSKQEAIDAWFADGPSDETLAQWEREHQESERNKCK